MFPLRHLHRWSFLNELRHSLGRLLPALQTTYETIEIALTMLQRIDEEAE